MIIFIFSKYSDNGQFSLRDVPARNHGSCIHHLGGDVCFDEYSYHASQHGLLGHKYNNKRFEVRMPLTFQVLVLS